MPKFPPEELIAGSLSALTVLVVTLDEQGILPKEQYRANLARMLAAVRELQKREPGGAVH
jgi:hypothetical protein